MSQTESANERATRVRAILAASRRLVDAEDPLGREARRLLPAATGLSKEGVELGLSRHLETSASDREIDLLAHRAGSAPRVHVLLSANVFVGVVRATALAVAASRSVRIRPSSREAVMAPLLLRAVSDFGALSDVEIRDRLEPRAGDVVHVYGRRDTIAAVTRESPPGVRIVGHGPGFGLAFVEAEGQSLELAAERMSWDVIAFDQRGCLSPRIALVDGSPSAVESFGETLASELEKREREVPRGSLTDDESSEQILYRSTASAIGRCHIGPMSSVGVDVSPHGLPLPPPGRNVHVARVTSPDDFERLLAPFRGAITCIGHQGETSRARELLVFARGARSQKLGGMQSPPLDGPADLRDML
jgi:hypothetical protein